MPSRSIRWSLSSLTGLVKALCKGRCLLTLATVLAVKAAWALDDTPDIDEADLALAREFSQQLEQRLLVHEAPYAQDERDFVAIAPDLATLPDPFIVPPAEEAIDHTVILPPAEPAVVASAAPEWVLYQAKVSPGAPEERLFNRINREYSQTLIEEPKMELPAWPEEAPAAQPSFEIFENEVISPFLPIPELDALPFPDA